MTGQAQAELLEEKNLFNQCLKMAAVNIVHRVGAGHQESCKQVLNLKEKEADSEVQSKLSF